MLECEREKAPEVGEKKFHLRKKFLIFVSLHFQKRSSEYPYDHPSRFIMRKIKLQTICVCRHCELQCEDDGEALLNLIRPRWWAYLSMERKSMQDCWYPGIYIDTTHNLYLFPFLLFAWNAFGRILKFCSHNYCILMYVHCAVYSPMSFQIISYIFIDKLSGTVKFCWKLSAFTRYDNSVFVKTFILWL